jgi:hypothetical protein
MVVTRNRSLRPKLSERGQPNAMEPSAGRNVHRSGLADLRVHCRNDRKASTSRFACSERSQSRVGLLTGDHEGCRLSRGAAPPIRFNRAVPAASQASRDRAESGLIALDVEHPVAILAFALKPTTHAAIFLLI